MLDKDLRFKSAEEIQEEQSLPQSSQMQSSSYTDTGVLMVNSPSLQSLVKDDYIQTFGNRTTQQRSQFEGTQGRGLDQQDYVLKASQTVDGTEQQKQQEEEEKERGASKQCLHLLEDGFAYSGSLPEELLVSEKQKDVQQLEEELLKESESIEEVGKRNIIIEGSVLPDGYNFGPKSAYKHVPTPQSLSALYTLLKIVVDFAMERVTEGYQQETEQSLQKKEDLESEEEDFQDELEGVEDSDSDEHSEWASYRWQGCDSRARTAFKLVAHWLRIPFKTLIAYEAGLAAIPGNSSEETPEINNVSSRRRWVKVGLAAAGGGTLLAITGGLAAPAIAVGLGGAVTILGGSAATATLVSGFAGSVGGVALTTTAFGAAGAARAGHIVAKATKSVQELGFWDLDYPIDNQNKLLLQLQDGQDDVKKASQSRSWSEWWQNRQRSKKIQQVLPYPCNLLSTRETLSVTIAISGWISNNCDFIDPWLCLPTTDTNCYAMIWESKLLKQLGNAIWKFLASTASSEAAKWFFQTFLFSSLMVALSLPFVANTLLGLMDNVWRVTQARAQKAGRLLARMLMCGAHGCKPVTLIGFSQGARVIFYCLLELRAHQAYGIVESVVMLGAPVGTDTHRWNLARQVVAGRFINGYCISDWVLGLVYRSSSGFLRQAAGFQEVDVPGIQNIDFSMIVKGHTEYQTKICDILEIINVKNK